MKHSDASEVLIETIRQSACPACAYQVAVPFFDGGSQPLATIAWPASMEDAKALPKLPLDFVRCVGCGHVYNTRFDYANIPYAEKPNLMFNQGAIWSGFIKSLRSRLLSQLPLNPVVVEIGHGDGSFIAALANGRTEGKFIGFDPHGAVHGHGGVTLRADMFVPNRHLTELKPDLIVSRHVLEHLMNPLAFLQEISFAACCLGLRPLAYFEVPCIDRALETGRTVDFYYEHSSQFTTESFTRMVSNCGAEIIEIGHGYNGEVVFGLMRLGRGSEHVKHASEAQRFFHGAQQADHTIREQLSALCERNKRIAIWGGTGKSAAFMQRYGLDADRFPVVVDDDTKKVGTYVPGTGQKIVFRDWLIENPVDVIIIPAQWRAADIMAVMQRVGIKAESVLIEHNRRLVDFVREDHPYHDTSQ